jgi:predicted TIM-barrel fold metal-dependent hydrolase
VLLAYETYARTFAWIREAGLPDEDADRILERNAPALLKLD